MKIRNQLVDLESMTQYPLELIKRMASKCWQSDSNKSPEEFVAMLIRKDHTSQLEHASMSVSVITDRGITHEIVRHRIGFSYSQESTRYVKYDGGMEVMSQDLKKAGFDTFEQAILSAERAYAELIEQGHKPQVARSVLPNCTKADIGITANFRAWRQFLRLRLSPAAHPMIREVAREIWHLLPIEIVSDICIGCGKKPYKWELTEVGHGIVSHDDEVVWSVGDTPPPNRYFPLCGC